MAKKASPALTWIIAEAKRIRRASPGKKWITCTKEASAAYRRRNNSAAPRAEKKPAAPRKKAKGVGLFEGSGVPTVKASAKNIRLSVSGSQTSAAKLKAELRRRINERLDRDVVRKYRATKKRDKKKIQKSITAAKSELKRLS